MKTKLCFLIFLLATAMAQAQTNNLTTLLQQGLLDEQANQNLDAAIASYQSLATQFDKDRQLAGTAVFRIGECYRMQGKTNEAAAQYERVLKDFSDQTTLATLSRQNLTGMGIAEPTAGMPENSDVALWNKLKDMPRDQLEKILPTLVPDASFMILLQRCNETEATLAQMQVNYASENPEVLKQKALLDVLNKQISARTDGILAGLKMRAELNQPSSANTQGTGTVTTDEEAQEIQRIQTMIQNSPDLINARGEGGNPPLAQATAKGWLKVATYLIEHGADVNGNGGAALSEATSAGNRAMVELLLSRGADVNSSEWKGKTPLLIAVEKKFPAVAEVLLANKADVNAQSRGGWTPLISAASANHVEIVKMLLAAGTNPNQENEEGRTPLSFAVESGSPEIVKMLLAAQADPNGGKLDVPLLVAIHKNDVAVAELLLQAGANPNLKTNIHWSMHFANTVYPQGINISPLFLAVINNQLPMVELILKYKADPNDSQTDGRPLVFSALDKPEILAALLDAGAKAEVRDETDNTIMTGGLGTFQGRLQTLMSPNLKRTPLLYVAGSESNAVAVAELLQHGANPNACDGRGNTALHYAAMWLADEKVFSLLLNAKANPNVRNSDGNTPLDLVKERLRLQISGSRFPNQNQAGINYGEVSAEQKNQAEKLMALLHQHGALDNLPDWDRITMSRPSANLSSAVFLKNTNDWNHFTLLELLLQVYPNPRYSSFGEALTKFPDLSGLVIVRPSANGTELKRIPVNLLNATDGVDCSRDVSLEFGDVVEIPEREHTLAEGTTFLTQSQFMAILDYFRSKSGEVKLAVSGAQTVSLPLQPMFSQIGEVLAKADARAALTSKSDLSRVRVIRHDPKTGKKLEWIVDCTKAVDSRNSNNAPDLWLRNGDVIEVPEKR